MMNCNTNNFAPSALNANNNGDLAPYVLKRRAQKCRRTRGDHCMNVDAYWHGVQEDPEGCQRTATYPVAYNWICDAA